MTNEERIDWLTVFGKLFRHDLVSVIYEQQHVLVRNDRGIKVPGWTIIQISDFSRNPFPDGIPAALEGGSE